LTLDGDEVAAARIAITALAPTIRRVPEAEAVLVGTAAGANNVESAARAAAEAASPIADIRASERYRRAMAAVITRRAINAALTRARGERVPIPASGSTT
jgi:CO/xanthine dehydrogenase FAD-binding subunit